MSCGLVAELVDPITVNSVSAGKTTPMLSLNGARGFEELEEEGSIFAGNFFGIKTTNEYSIVSFIVSVCYYPLMGKYRAGGGRKSVRPSG